MTNVVHIEAVKGKGWLPELPDYRDYPLSKLGLVEKAAQSLPEQFDFRHKMSPVRDQGYLGSCTGFALTAAVEYLQRIDGDQWNTVYSPLFAYFHARIADGLEWQTIDSGAYIRDVAKTAADVGVTPESSWPYIQAKFARKPHKTAHRKAEAWKAGAYYKCLNLTNILTALTNNYPVIGGFACFSNMFTNDVQNSGIIPLPSGVPDGGHAVCFVGYDRFRKRLMFKNSWGEDWGSGGYGYLPFEYVEKNLAGDFWCITRESETTVYRGPGSTFQK